MDGWRDGPGYGLPPHRRDSTQWFIASALALAVFVLLAGTTGAVTFAIGAAAVIWLIVGGLG